MIPNLKDGRARNEKVHIGLRQCVTKDTPSTPAGRWTPRPRRLSLVGIPSRSCHENTTTFEGAQDFQTQDIASKVSPEGTPTSGKPCKRWE